MGHGARKLIGVTKFRLGGARAWIRGGLVGLAVSAALLAGVFERFELQALDGQFRLRGPRAPQTPIAIISIDEDSFDELDLAWPWPRALYGKLLEVLSQGKPAAVGLDILFSEPSPRG